VPVRLFERQRIVVAEVAADEQPLAVALDVIALVARGGPGEAMALMPVTTSSPSLMKLVRSASDAGLELPLRLLPRAGDSSSPPFCRTISVR
jgi:hypothetical protein